MKKLITLTFILCCFLYSPDTFAQEDAVFKVVEDMPMFPGCEDIVNDEEARACAQQKMLEYIYANVDYPQEARKKGVEGTAIVQFVINKEGRVEDSKVLEDPGSGLGDAALKAIDGMNDMVSPWHPGKQRGNTVKVEYTLPVKFKLGGDK